MPSQGLSLIFPLLFICFFRESFCICDGTTWTKVGWEIFPEETHYLKVKPSPSHCLPYPLDKLCCNFASMDIFQSCLHLIYILVQALFLILSVLSAHYLWVKWKKHQKKLKKQASLDTAGNDLESQSIYDADQILCRLVATTSMITKYLNQVSHHPPAKKVKHQKLKGKRVKEKEPEDTRHIHMQI
ncbi:testis-expressed protein 50 [Eubalaena glacialis]|uniref:testis-expressed protein 50 n=1 Tax=Eubalaena glacialis TaxID=27606 RepID=UPI002A5AFE9B|nr:testis-expressed protein 50 [Eubalaena glacialis]